jgi:hypothetical protein
MCQQCKESIDCRDHRIRVSINRAYRGKWPASAFGRIDKPNNWKVEQTTPRDFAIAIYRGYAFTMVFDGKRHESNFSEAWHFALDFDGGDEACSFDALMEDDLINFFSSFLYYTPSANPEEGIYKTRAVFVFEDPIVDLGQYRLFAEAMLHRFPTADQACKDGARLFFGAEKCQLLDNWSIMTAGTVGEIIRQFQESRPPERKRSVVNGKIVKPTSAGGLGLSKLNYLANKCASAADGEKYVTLRNCSVAVGGYVAGGYLAESEAKQALVDAVDSMNNVRDKSHAIKAIDEGISHGKTMPLYFHSDTDSLPRGNMV